MSEIIDENKLPVEIFNTTETLLLNKIQKILESNSISLKTDKIHIKAIIFYMEFIPYLYSKSTKYLITEEQKHYIESKIKDNYRIGYDFFELDDYTKNYVDRIELTLAFILLDFKYKNLRYDDFTLRADFMGKQQQNPDLFNQIIKIKKLETQIRKIKSSSNILNKIKIIHR